MRNWITIKAPLSPKSRNVRDLDKRITHIEKYEKWANCSQIPIIDIVGKYLYRKYFSKLDQIVSEMWEAQRMADIIRAKIHNALDH